MGAYGLKPLHFAPLFLLILIIFTYSPTFDSSPTHVFIDTYDDGVNILDADCLRKNFSQAVACAFLSRVLDVYEPLSVLAKWAQYNLFGLQPWAWKSVTLLIHCLNTALLFRIFSRSWHGGSWKSREAVLAYVLASVFALHPLRVEVVAWASGQPYAISAFFALLHFDFSLSVPGAQSNTMKGIYSLLLALTYSFSVLSKAASIGVSVSSLLFAMRRKEYDTQSSLAREESRRGDVRYFFLFLPSLLLAFAPIMAEWTVSGNSIPCVGASMFLIALPHSGNLHLQAMSVYSLCQKGF
uniref:GPI mannosyltransferase 2 n=1 Tax=Palpitomonas bilix TaxID=652834 RepID=A0A7S3D914_9EUKA|mmetsp:Transcript_26849/g.69027  ORF Transcript_26849/g.69027 Transcript_26849/m.69027 type:complete len:297 (+) Transcript_26849:96-986(+)